MRTKIVLLASLFLTAADAQVWAQTQYCLTDLGPLAGNDANGINASGQIAGGKQFGSEYNAFLYSGGSMQDLGTLSSSQTWSVAAGINNAGQVVGTSQQSNGAGPSNGFIYSSGTLLAISALGSVGHTTGNAINNAGQVVGLAEIANTGVTEGYLYSGGTTIALGCLGGNYSDASGINDHTQIVGTTTTASGQVRGYIWQNGAMTDLGDLQGGSGQTQAYAINNNGAIVGETTVPGASVGHAFIWQSGLMTDLGVLPGTNNSLAQGINDEDQAVGTSYTGGTDEAFLWDSAYGIQNLDSLLDSSGEGWTLEGAKGINDAGQIIGYGVNPLGQTDGFLLTPTPEPGTLALLGAGAVVMLGGVWRRRVRRPVALHRSPDSGPHIVPFHSRSSPRRQAA